MRELPQQQHADLGLVDHEPAGDDPEESRTAPEPQMLAHLAGTDRNHPNR